MEYRSLFVRPFGDSKWSIAKSYTGEGSVGSTSKDCAKRGAESVLQISQRAAFDALAYIATGHEVMVLRSNRPYAERVSGKAKILNRVRKAHA